MTVSLSILETSWSPTQPHCQQPFHTEQNNEFHHPGSYKNTTKFGVVLPPFTGKLHCTVGMDRCVGLTLENLATITCIPRILYEEIQKAQHSLVQPQVFANRLHQMVLFEGQLQKQVIWLQFSDLLLLSLELWCLCFLFKVNFVSVCYLSPLPDCFLPQSPHSSIK